MAEMTFVQDAPVAEEASWASAPFRLGESPTVWTSSSSREVIRSQKVFPRSDDAPIRSRRHQSAGNPSSRSSTSSACSNQTPWREDPDTRLLILQQDQTVVGWAVDAVGDIAWSPVSRIEPLSYEARRTGAQVRRSDRKGSRNRRRPPLSTGHA